jgi:PAS domain S-box-containing protein
MSLTAQKTPTQTPLIAALEQLGPHDHFCSIYESPQEHYAVAVPFIRIGLARGEKCIYIADDGTVGDVREAMALEGIDVDRAIASNALVLATKEQAYLEHGSFHPDWMFTFWKEATQLAMSEGFSAVRATGETEWVLRGGRGLERWMEYESKLTHTLLESNCSALCQYNRRLFPPELILDVIRTHPVVVYGSTVCRNLYYVPPDEFLGTNQTAREVERLLTNIRERERVEDALREQLSERRRAEEELRRSEASLAEGQRISHTGSWSWNVATGDLFWSQEHFRIFGFDPETAKPSHSMFLERIHPNDRSFVEQTVDWAVRERTDFELDYRIVLANGSIRYLQSLGHPVLGESGDLVEFVGTVIDATERRGAEEALREAQAELGHDDYGRINGFDCSRDQAAARGRRHQWGCLPALVSRRAAQPGRGSGRGSAGHSRWESGERGD